MKGSRGTRSRCLQSFNPPLAPYLAAGKKPRETMGLGTRQLLIEEGTWWAQNKRNYELCSILLLKKEVF